MGYKQLDYLTRCKIYGLWRAGFKQIEIAKEVGVHKSTIRRELKRNITWVRTAWGSWQYKPDYAQHYAEARRKKKPKHYWQGAAKSNSDFGRTCISKDTHWASRHEKSGFCKRANYSIVG